MLVFQLQSQVLIYNSYQRYYVLGGLERLSGEPKAYKFAESGFTDISSGLPSGSHFRFGIFSRYDGNTYFIFNDGKIYRYDGTSWTFITTTGAPPIAFSIYRNSNEAIAFAATEGNTYLVDLINGTSSEDYSADGVIEDITSTNFKIWIADRSGSTLSVKRRDNLIPGTFTEDFSFSNVGQARFGLQYRILTPSVRYRNGLSSPSAAPVSLHLAHTSSSDSSVGAKIWRRNPSSARALSFCDTSNKWTEEDTIYHGRSKEAAAGAPYYLQTIPRGGFICLRRCMMLFLPYSNSSPGSLPGDGMDLWARKERLTDDYTASWFHERNFIGRVLEDEEHLLMPGYYSEIILMATRRQFQNISEDGTFIGTVVGHLSAFQHVIQYFG